MLLCEGLRLVERNAEVTQAIARVLPTSVIPAFTSRLSAERVLEVVAFYRTTGDWKRFKKSVLGLRSVDVAQMKDISLEFARVAEVSDWVDWMRLDVHLSGEKITEVFEMVTYTLLQDAEPKLFYWALTWLAWLLRSVSGEAFEKRRLELESLYYTEPNVLSPLTPTAFVVSEMQLVDVDDC